MPTPEREAPAAVVATSAPEVVPCREMATVFEEEVKPAAASAAARVVLSKARAPRRSRSEKMSPRGVGSRRAASPEQQLMPLMRRSESDNGRRRRSSASARDVAAAWAPGTDDAAEFQRKVEAFIAKQTRFRREEECMAGVLVAVE
jgi:hypothetical protein